MSSQERIPSSTDSSSFEREQRWKDTRLVFLRAEDEQVDRDVWNPGDVELHGEILTRALLSLRDWLTHALTLQEESSYRARLDDVNFLLEMLPQDLPSLAHLTSPEEHPSQVDRLSSRIPCGPIGEIAPLLQTGRWRVPGKARDYEVDRMKEVFSSLDQPFFVSASDSHRSTGSVFRALGSLGALDPKRPRAVLSFDHHSDAKQHVPGYGTFGKEDVMSSIVGAGLAQAVAVIGIQKHFDTPGPDVASRMSLYGGRELYNGDRPSFEKFQLTCKQLFDAWKTAGIVDIYPSVDLDGLRVDELRYEGTDYSVSRLRRKAIRDLTSRQHWIEYVRRLTPDSKENIEGILAQLEASARYYRDSHEYYGIPAAWVAYALEEAQRQGFHVGIRDTVHNATIVGDVTELHRADPKGRTTRIACALLDRMVRIAQEGERD